VATLARKVCLLENCGREQKYVHAELGFNSRMDSLSGSCAASEATQAR
jgi:dTDP-4-amino-4,6-dideoxygalactose transaminase